MTVLHARSAGSTKALQREIAGQMKDLPLEGLLTLREFTAFLRQRSLTEHPAASTPLSPLRLTVEMSAESLMGLMGYTIVSSERSAWYEHNIHSYL